MKHFTLIFCLIFFASTCGSVPVSGNFQATQSCPAYISKNKKTNPDNAYISANQPYKLIEINKNNNPDWVRIELPDTDSALRWVDIKCGIADYEHAPTDSCQQKAGMADSYVLGLSWQPGFCQTYGYEAGKAECLSLPANSYQASHLVLHGLWPNQIACGQAYGFCSVKARAHHCEYPPLTFSNEVAEALRLLMPSYAYGSCLERHEWNKHGSCQILSTDDYFSLAMRLTREADRSELGQYLHEARGKRVARSDLLAHIADAFGGQNNNKVYLGCKNGILVDIFIQLPALIPADESLTSLINKAPSDSHHDGCPYWISISDFTNERV